MKNHIIIFSHLSGTKRHKNLQDQDPENLTIRKEQVKYQKFNAKIIRNQLLCILSKKFFKILPFFEIIATQCKM
jgi:hypothetical protein